MKDQEARAKAAQDHAQAEECRRKAFELLTPRQQVYFWERAFIAAGADGCPWDVAEKAAHEALEARNRAVQKIVRAYVIKT